MPYDTSHPVSPSIALGDNYWSHHACHPAYAATPVNNGLHAPFIPLAGSESDWAELARLCAADASLSLPVVGANRGGLLVEWRVLRGFVPASQLIDFPIQGSEDVRQAAMAHYLGRLLNLRIIELCADRNRLILSERAAQAQPGGRARILIGVVPGTTVCGIITNLTDFGAFLDLGGLEGLIHISELSWGRVSHPAAILKRGQQVEAYVLEVDRSTCRIALSVKRLRPDPWLTCQQRYVAGQVVNAVITNIVEFGAFASIEDGLEGLIHLSELSDTPVLHPASVVAEGQHVRLRILTLNCHARRMGLSLRAVE